MRMKTVVERSNLTPRTHGKIMRDVMETTGKRHMTRRVGKHFRRIPETTAGGAYGYARRSKQTKEKKKRLGVDPNRPNFVTGVMMAVVKSLSRLTRTQHKWTWKAKSPFPLNAQRRRELEAISKAEIDADTKLMEETYARLAAKPENARKRRSKRGGS